MPMMRRRSRYTRRTARNSGVGYRFMTVAQFTPISVAIGGTSTVQLLDPVFFQTAGITKKAKIVSVQGHISVAGNTTYPACAAASIDTFGAGYALGLYVDTGIVAVAKNPLAQSYSLDWMLWRAGQIANSRVCSGAGSPQSVADAFNWQRWNLQTRKYTRNIDPSDDTLVLVVANSGSSTTTIGYTYNFRILIVEP